MFSSQVAGSLQSLILNCSSMPGFFIAKSLASPLLPFHLPKMDGVPEPRDLLQILPILTSSAGDWLATPAPSLTCTQLRQVLIHVLFSLSHSGWEPFIKHFFEYFMDGQPYISVNTWYATIVPTLKLLQGPDASLGMRFAANTPLSIAPWTNQKTLLSGC
jgi:hypothetical protein